MFVILCSVVNVLVCVVNVIVVCMKVIDRRVGVRVRAHNRHWRSTKPNHREHIGRGVLRSLTVCVSPESLGW